MTFATARPDAQSRTAAGAGARVASKLAAATPIAASVITTRTTTTGTRWRVRLGVSD